MFGCRATVPIDIELHKAGPEETLSDYLDDIHPNEPEDFTWIAAVFEQEQQKGTSRWRLAH